MSRLKPEKVDSSGRGEDAHSQTAVIDACEEPEEPMTFDDDEITEENYRTTFEIETDPDEEADGLEDYVED